ncbi:MAG TPA: cob(I)yrinic acid a,c-diamide adenosyltransferase, partial [Dongiaceae bacterium]|nr:cob(I)yrinic acid a,c-diamide adenosyltransferase [Dongiaceae bacterium]
MVKLTRIYTKGGDKGTTSLGTGKRVPKHDLRVEAYGTVDEANAAIGIARLHTSGDADAALARIQNDLFDLGADLCAPEGEGSKERLRITDAQVERLEQEIDAMNEELAPLNSFVLPGG